MPRPKVFVSAVTSQLKACRDVVASDLRAKGYEVKVQEDFQQGPHTLIQQIERYVDECGLVVAIIGDAYGAEAAPAAVPKVDPPRSYTQWEYFFAIGERLDGKSVAPKNLFVYFASEGYRREHTVAQIPAHTDRQRAFVEKIRDSGKHWSEFDSVDRLGRLLLRDLEPELAAPLPPVDPQALASFGELRAALSRGDKACNLTDAHLNAVLRHSPRDLEEYRLARIAEWSQSRYALDKRFTHLTLLIDQGRDAQGPRFQAQSQSFDDLQAAMDSVDAPVFVVLGPPGSGKSTLLRRFELDRAREALTAPDSNGVVTLFVSLNRYAPAAPGSSLPPPAEWLAKDWEARHLGLPKFEEVRRTGRMVFLLDALNEMPHAGDDDYRQRVALWRAFAADMVRTAPGTRVVVSCRSLDYSESLSTPELAVPHVRIERLTDEQVEHFLSVYSEERGARMWAELRGTAQLDLFRSPFYLKMLLDQSGGDGKLPAGRAALFTGFVRQALTREIDAGNDLFRAGALFDAREHTRVVQRLWRDECDLPARGPLFSALAALAFGLQARRVASEEAQVRAKIDEALSLLGSDQPERLLQAGVDLQLLDDDRLQDDVLFVHQLLQEYFAARAVTARLEREPGTTLALARTPWRADEMHPSLPEVIAGLGDSDPLPAAPATGWEETFMLAAAMTPARDGFVEALMAVNLPLAGRCAAQPDVPINPELRAKLQQALIDRSRDSSADLRARIAAARALGELGDPRFERRTGPDGDYLLPPLVCIQGGTYRVGSDEGPEQERPIHEANVASFQIGTFPVTNAEWRLFMEAGGYESDSCWDSDDAKAWQRGENTSEEPKQQWRRSRRDMLQSRFSEISQWARMGRITLAQAQQWVAIARMSDLEFEALLDRWYPKGRQTQPLQWNDPTFNHPSQPVVGICWYEARAYCSWLSAQSGHKYRLPTEIEWEVAARGRSDRRYAWGDAFDATRCNTFESHVRSTTPIGIYSEGETPSSNLCDMTGNTWDWTNSSFESYPRDAQGARDEARGDLSRVVRGGSWFVNQGYARASFRFFPSPKSRIHHIGLRLVRASESER